MPKEPTKPDSQHQFREISVFPTKIWICPTTPEITGCLPDLMNLALSLREDHQPSAPLRSARESWRFDNPHLLQSFAVAQQHIQGLLAKACQSLNINNHAHSYGSWIHIMDAWGQHTPHHHNPNFLSGVFYINLPRQSAPLILRDPRTTKTSSGWQKANDEISVSAESGSTIIFPAWMEHYVEARKQNKNRISLSFNLGA
jgi:uncharacterized protein (TIGR02466 family)